MISMEWWQSRLKQEFQVLRLLCVPSLPFQEILGGPHAAEEKYDAEFFKKFRTQNIVLSARDYARVTNSPPPWNIVDFFSCLFI